MPTDDERREVARRMRETAEGKFDFCAHNVALEIGMDDPSDFDDCFDGEHLEAWRRLADLIEPPYPDATASYKGWRAEVYDPDGVLASPSNVAADLVRAHADGKAPSEPKVRCVAEVKVDGERLEELVHDAAVELTGIDREALLEVLDEMEITVKCAGPDVERDYVENWANEVREALGVNDG